MAFALKWKSMKNMSGVIVHLSMSKKTQSCNNYYCTLMYAYDQRKLNNSENWRSTKTGEGIVWFLLQCLCQKSNEKQEFIGLIKWASRCTSQCMSLSCNSTIIHLTWTESCWHQLHCWYICDSCSKQVHILPHLFWTSYSYRDRIYEVIFIKHIINNIQSHLVREGTLKPIIYSVL